MNAVNFHETPDLPTPRLNPHEDKVRRAAPKPAKPAKQIKRAKAKAAVTAPAAAPVPVSVTPTETKA